MEKTAVCKRKRQQTLPWYTHYMVNELICLHQTRQAFLNYLCRGNETNTNVLDICKAERAQQPNMEKTLVDFFSAINKYRTISKQRKDILP